MPKADIASLNRQTCHHPNKAKLRMILRCQGLCQIAPSRLWHIKIKPRQNNRPLRQQRYGLHKLKGCAPRSSRAGNNNRVWRRREGPFGAQIFDHTPLPCLGIKRVIRRPKKGLNNLQKLQCPRPMTRLIADVKLGNRCGCYALTLHFIH